MLKYDREEIVSHSTFSKISTCLATVTAAVALVAGASALSYYGFANAKSIALFEDQVSNAANGSLAVSLDDPNELVEEEQEVTEEPTQIVSEIKGGTIDREERIKAAKETGMTQDQAEIADQVMQSQSIDDQSHPVFDIKYTTPEKFIVGASQGLMNMTTSNPNMQIASSGAASNQTITSTGQMLAFSRTTGILRMYGTMSQLKANGGGTQIGTNWQPFTSIHNADWDGDGVLDIVAFKDTQLYIYKGLKNKPGFAVPIHVATFNQAKSRPIVTKIEPKDKHVGVIMLEPDGKIGTFPRKTNDVNALDVGKYLAKVPANSQLLAIKSSSSLLSDIVVNPKSGRFEIMQRNNAQKISQITNVTGGDILATNRNISIDGFVSANSRGIIEVRHTEATGGTLYYSPINGTTGAVSAKQKIGTSGWAVMVISNGSTTAAP